MKNKKMFGASTANLKEDVRLQKTSIVNLGCGSQSACEFSCKCQNACNQSEKLSNK